MISDDPSDKPPCRGCSSYLTEPYIKCAECGPSPFLLCLQVNRSQKLLNLPADKPSPTETKHFVSLQCFTRGFEYKKHQSDHKYEIMVSEIKNKQTNKYNLIQCGCLSTSMFIFHPVMQTSDFPVLEPGWTAQEEMALLEAVMDCGFGNWLVFSTCLVRFPYKLHTHVLIS